MRAIPAGDDLELRPVTLADVCPLYAAVDRNRERLMRWLPWATRAYSVEDMRRFVEEKSAGNLSGLALTMGIWSAGALCGAIELHRIDLQNKSSSIGYWIDGAWEGRGIVSSACRAMITEGFTNFGLHRIEIRCAIGNERSAAIARKLGFIEEGILQEGEWLHDHWVDLRVFRMLEHEWTR